MDDNHDLRLAAARRSDGHLEGLDKDAGAASEAVRDEEPEGGSASGSGPKAVRSVWVQKLAVDRFSALYILVLVVVVFSILVPDLFPTSQNLRFIIVGQSVALMMSLSLILPVAAKNFDLSIGGGMTLSVALVAWLQSAQQVNALLAALIAVAVGALVGILNGFIVVTLRVSSFIATLGTMSILVAAGYWIMDGFPISTGISSAFFEFGQEQIFQIPLPFFYMLGLCLILWYVMEFSPIGRVVRAIGGNVEAARMTGVRVNRYIFGTFIASGVIAAFVGVVFTAQLGNAPIDPGSAYLLPAYSAVFLGSTQLQRGRVNVWGTVIALYLLATGTNGLQLMFPGNAWIKGMFEGIALIIAVAFAARSAHKKAAERT